MNHKTLTISLFGLLATLASAPTIYFACQLFIGVYALLTNDFNESEQGRLGLLVLVVFGVFAMSAGITFWAFRKCHRLWKS